MSRTSGLIVAGALFLLALQALLLHSWSHHGSSYMDSPSKGAQAERQIQRLLAESQDLNRTHQNLVLRVQAVKSLQAAGTLQTSASDVSKPGCIGSALDTSKVIAAVVVITYNRPKYLKRCIKSVLNTHMLDSDNRQKFPLHISQDGNDSAVAQLASSINAAAYLDEHVDSADLPHVEHMQHPQESSFPTRNPSEPMAYYRIASHYKFVMQQIFDCWQYPKLIILEDDMELSVDFFTYFEAGGALLDSSPDLYCISSWNDHGQAAHVHDHLRLERSDFFPGLGWMLTNMLWQSFRDSWPAAYWDDWMRLSSVRQGRQCIRPEVCRTYNFGERGSSHGQFYNKFLRPIKLNDIPVDWGQQDLQYLQPVKYEEQMTLMVASANQMTAADGLQGQDGLIKLVYSDKAEYDKLASKLGIIDDWKDSIPRASYQGIVKVFVDRTVVDHNSTGDYCLLVPANGSESDAG